MIKATNIEKSYNGEKVLWGVSLNINDGEFVSIMGESGSGKSTLLSILGGFLDPDCGNVILNGKDISEMSESELSRIRCTELGFVFQSFRLIPTLSARDNILLPAALGGRLGKDGEEYLAMLSDALGINALLDKFPTQLSGGQCQRVAIARALVYKPSIVILDEPTGALDSGMEKRVMELLSDINQRLGTTIIQVTHSSKVAEYGNRMIRLADGKIL